MTAVSRPLYIEQGATFTLGFNWYRASVSSPGQPGEPYAPTAARMQLRRKVTDTEVLVSATTENGKITLGPNGRIDVRLEATDTDLLNVKSAVYDLEAVIGSDVHRLLEGPVTISPNVTR